MTKLNQTVAAYSYDRLASFGDQSFMSSVPPQALALFEDDYLLRELGQVAHVPQVALTELVANAWDAGASKVELILPAEVGGTLTVTDDGHGMTPVSWSSNFGHCNR